MTKLRGIRYSLIFLKIINFIAILFSSSLYLHATNYIIAKGQGYQLLEQLRAIPSSPAQNFWISILLFGGILLITFYRMRQGTQEWSVFDKWNILEILLMLGVMMALSFSSMGSSSWYLLISFTVPKSLVVPKIGATGLPLSF